MSAISETKLLIVYNADSGFFNALSSSIHKALSPDTYECQLCRITYGMTHMVGEWKAYLDSLAVPVQALHRNEFLAQYPALATTALPAIFLVQADVVEVFLDAETIQKCPGITALIESMDTAIVSSAMSLKEGV
jgi:hypothetical protein